MTRPRISRNSWLLCNSLTCLLTILPNAAGLNGTFEHRADPATEEIWHAGGSLAQARRNHSTTILESGKALHCGGGLSNADAMATCELYDPESRTVSNVAALRTARRDHGAVLLSSGHVLVFGGRNPDDGELESAELYDPQEDIWRDAPPLHRARRSPTITLLTDHRVLVVGGSESNAGHLASVEIYDSEANTWTETAPLPRERTGHTATRLEDGRVLIVGGGANTGGDLATAVLFDPVTEDFASTASMSKGRRWHTAVLLDDGRVLVAGGRVDGPPSASVEIFDSETATWEEAAGLAVPRYEHHAVLLPDGRVLVTGGTDSLGGALGSTEIYHTASDSWHPAADLLTARWFNTLSLLKNGSLLVTGGKNSTAGGPQAGSEIFTPANGDWKVSAPMPTPRYGAAGVILADGRILMVGGRDETVQIVPIAEIYDPLNDSWSTVAAPPLGRIGHFSVLLHDGRILVGGGWREDTGFLTTCELYNPTLDTWTTAGPLSNGRSEPSSLLLEDGRVLVTGGWNEIIGLTSTEIYSPVTNTWQTAEPLHHGRRLHAGLRLTDGRILVTGGASPEGVLSTTEIYDPTADTWTVVGPLTERRFRHAIALLPNGRVLASGGQNTPLTPFHAEIFNPATGVWSPTGALRQGHWRHAAVPLTNGKILIVGGFSESEEVRAEIFDPTNGAFVQVGTSRAGRKRFTASLLATGEVFVVGGKDEDELILPDSELFTLAAAPSRQPEITQAPSQLHYGDAPALVVDGVFDGPQPGDGTSQNAARLRPSLSLSALANDRLIRLTTTGPLEGPLTVEELPSDVPPGWYRLFPHGPGLSGQARLVQLECQVVIHSEPADATIEIGDSVTFEVETRGVRSWQWQRSVDGIFLDIPGATGATYTSPPVAGQESGTLYRIVVGNGCSSATSREVLLTVEDAEDPTVEVVAPNGGEFIALSVATEPPRSIIATWTMQDDVRICQVEVEFFFSNNQGSTWEPVEGEGFSAIFGPGGTCTHPGETTTNFEVVLPQQYPSGTPGSQYQMQVRVQDHLGKTTTARSEQHFYMFQPDPSAKKTLILTNMERMQNLQEFDSAVALALQQDLEEFAAHDAVQGLVVDLGERPTLTQLYLAWDNDQQDPLLANRVLFDEGGVATILGELLTIYSGVEYLVLVGDDQVLPFARLNDTTVLVTEEDYVQGIDLQPFTTSVGRALGENLYLSDDPLAMLIPPTAAELNTDLFLPDLAVGRLVERPEHISTTIDTFLAQDGVVDLGLLTDTKALITGYDFFVDSSIRILNLFQGFFGGGAVDGELVNDEWGQDDLLTHLCAAAQDAPFPLTVWNGHANHYVLGHPGTSVYEIAGTETTELLAEDRCGPGEGLDLTGGIILSPGCHVGLPVAGSDDPNDHPLDLPEALLSRGALAYVANTGYGWGLRFGVGYSERLLEMFAEELVLQGSSKVGQVLKQVKLRYFLETPRFDPYDRKILQEWTLFGLPMVEVRHQQPVDLQTTPQPNKDNLPPTPESLAESEQIGAVTVHRKVFSNSLANALKSDHLPAHLLLVQTSFDFSASDVYRKFDADGTELNAEPPGCPDSRGCYYSLNGLTIGRAGLPLLPYLVYESRLSGTSQHGVLWSGGTYIEEQGWVPLFAELMTNVPSPGSPAPAPRKLMIEPFAVRWEPGLEPTSCQGSDSEINMLILTTGEVHDGSVDDPPYSVLRRHLGVDIEIFYFNDQTNTTNDCDRTGPLFLPPPSGQDFHQLAGNALHFQVPVTDDEGVWRVLVVFDDGSRDASNQGSWKPLELLWDASSDTWQGTLEGLEVGTISYVLQAVDHQGNVAWYDYVTANNPDTPDNGVPLNVPMIVVVEITTGAPELSISAQAVPNPVVAQQPVFYSVEITNDGLDPAAAVEVVFTAPPGAEAISATGDGWTCTTSGLQVDCARNDLAAGTAAPPINIFLLAPAEIGLATAYGSVDSRDPDPKPGNNTTSIDILVVEEDTSHQIFADGFESGDVSLWDGV